MKAVGLTSHIHANTIRSILLLAGFPFLIFLMILSFCVGLYSFGLITPKPIPFAQAWTQGTDMALRYGHWAVIVAVGWFAIAYFSHTKLIGMMTDAKEVTRNEEPKLFNMMENLCISRGFPMPRFQIIESDALNAFASGLDQKSYAITVTRGLLNKLEDDEIEAVLAHELTHILNKDVRLLIISVVFVGMISFFCEMAFRSMIYNRPRSSNDSNKNTGGIMILALAILAIGWIFAMVIRFAMSRKREYLADAGAVELTKNPEAMMRALLRISGKDTIEDLPEDIELMCIENTSGFMGVFATHPPIEKRVKVLSEMTDTPIPTLGTTTEKSKTSNPWS